MEAAFDIGLVEAREGHAGVHGNEERVDVFGAVVAILEASERLSSGRDVGQEMGFDGVLTLAQRGSGKFDVAVVESCSERFAVDRDCFEFAVAEIEEERACSAQNEIEPRRRQRSRSLQ